MDRKVYTFDETRAHTSANRYKSWQHGSEGPTSARERFEGDFFYVAHKPKFRFPRSAKVFMIGSCFARDIEGELLDQGISVLTEGLILPPDFYQNGARPNAAMNKFNIPSILDELERAFAPDDDPRRGLIPVADGRWFDPLTTSLRTLTDDEAVHVRRSISATMRGIAEADVIVFTLSRVEMWRDRFSGLHLNAHPHPEAVRFDNARRYEHRKTFLRAQRQLELAAERGLPEDPGLRSMLDDPCFRADLESRFEFQRPSFAFLRKEMQRIVEICAKVAPRARLVVTVSPVPLLTTMLPDDIVCSTTYSKSLLRVIAEEMREAYPQVDYFPSYEMVSNSRRATTWLEDQAHVVPQTTAEVTSTFVREWFED